MKKTILKAHYLLVHDDRLTPPTNNLEAAVAFIFRLLDSRSKRLAYGEDVEDPEKIDAELIDARFSLLFLSNF